MLSAPYVTKNLNGDEHGLFVVDEYFFIVVSYQACVWSCSVDLILLPGLWPPHPSAVCSILQYTKRPKPSADKWAIAPWVRVVPFVICASLVQSVCVRVDDDVFLVATWKLFWDIFLPGAACLYSGASPVDLACLWNHLLHTFRYWCVAVTHRILL